MVRAGKAAGPYQLERPAAIRFRLGPIFRQMPEPARLLRQIDSREAFPRWEIAKQALGPRFQRRATCRLLCPSPPFRGSIYL